MFLGQNNNQTFIKIRKKREPKTTQKKLGKKYNNSPQNDPQKASSPRPFLTPQDPFLNSKNAQMSPGRSWALFALPGFENNYCLTKSHQKYPFLDPKTSKLLFSPPSAPLSATLCHLAWRLSSRRLAIARKSSGTMHLFSLNMKASSRAVGSARPLLGSSLARLAL